jgi:integrase
MACLVAESGGRWRVEFTWPEKQRKKIRLGRMREAAAERFKEQLELLLEDLAGGAPSSDSRRWLEKLSDRLYARLAKKLPVQRRVSLSQWRKQFMESCNGLERESRRKLEQTFDRLVEFFPESRLLREISSEQAAEWRTWLEHGRSLATVKTHVGNARTIFARAVKLKVVGESPFEHQRGGSTPSDSLTFVPWESVELVLWKIKNPDLRLRVALCRYAGLRVDSEPPRLRWSEHVDFERRLLRVPCGKTKRYAGNSVRVVPIDDRLLPHLQLRHRLRMAGEDRVCQIGKLTGTHKVTVEAAIERAKVARWPRLFQALRASYDSELRANGVPTDFASKMTGHSAEVSRRHYTAIPEKMLRWVASMYSPEKQAAQKAAHRGAESVGTHGNNLNGDTRNASEIGHFPAFAGMGGNGWEVGDEGLEPPTSRV